MVYLVKSQITVKAVECVELEKMESYRYKTTNIF